MTSSYPTTLDTLATNKADGTSLATDHKNHHNDMADAINKIEIELGTLPKGAAATVKARLLAIEASILVVPRNFISTTKNLAVTDAATVFEHQSNSTQHTLTIPNEAGGEGFPEGFWFEVLQLGTATFTVAGESAGMLYSPLSSSVVDSVIVSPRYGTAQFRKVKTGNDFWHVAGSHALP